MFSNECTPYLCMYIKLCMFVCQPTIISRFCLYQAEIWLLCGLLGPLGWLIDLGFKNVFSAFSDWGAYHFKRLYMEFQPHNFMFSVLVHHLQICECIHPQIVHSC